MQVLRGSHYLEPDETLTSEGRYAPWPAGRWLARCAVADPASSLEVLRQIKDTVNPDAAASALDAAVALGPAAALGIVDALASWARIESSSLGGHRGVEVVSMLSNSGDVDAALVVTRGILGAQAIPDG